MAYDGIDRTYHTLNREYSPVVGRWNREDPMGNPNGLNRQEFLTDSPLDGVDPLGLFITKLPPPAKGVGNLDRAWAYGSIHHSTTSATLYLNNGGCADELVNDIYDDLKTFKRFNPNSEGVASVNGNIATFGLTSGLAHLADVVGINDEYYSVELAYHASEHMVRAVTLGDHALSGVREWRVFKGSTNGVCWIQIETEAYEAPRTEDIYVNAIGRFHMGLNSMISMWNQYIQAIASHYAKNSNCVVASTFSGTSVADLGSGVNPWLASAIKDFLK